MYSHSHTYTHSLHIHTHTVKHTLTPHTHAHTLIYSHTLIHHIHSLILSPGDVRMFQIPDFLCKELKQQSILGKEFRFSSSVFPLPALLRSSRALDPRVDSQGEIQAQDGEGQIASVGVLVQQVREAQGRLRQRGVLDSGLEE